MVLIWKPFKGYMTLLGFYHLTIAPVPRNNPWKFIADILSYLTVSNLKRCHIPFKATLVPLKIKSPRPLHAAFDCKGFLITHKHTEILGCIPCVMVIFLSTRQAEPIYVSQTWMDGHYQMYYLPASQSIIIWSYILCNLIQVCEVNTSFVASFLLWSCWLNVLSVDTIDNTHFVVNC